MLVLLALAILPVAVPHETALPPRWEAASAPVCAVAEDGAFLLAWESKGSGARDILFLRREPGDEGAWAARPARLDTDAAGASRSLEPRMAVGGPGRVYVAWQDARHGKDDVYLNRSADGGRTWLVSDVRIGSDAPGRAVSSMVSLAADRAGHVYLAWEDLRDGLRDIRFTRSTNAGVTWEEDRRVDSDPPGSGTSYHPQLAVWDDGTVLACWWDERDGLADLYVRRSTDGGVTWDGPEFRLDPGEPGEADSREAVLSTDRDAVAVRWGDAGKDMIVVSRDRGASWMAPVSLVPVDAPSTSRRR